MRAAWPKTLWAANENKSLQACTQMVKTSPEGPMESQAQCATFTFLRDLTAPPKPAAITLLNLGYN
jgi:hypothetical protein